MKRNKQTIGKKQSGSYARKIASGHTPRSHIDFSKSPLNK